MLVLFFTRLSRQSFGRFYISKRACSSQNTAVRVRFAPSPTGDLHLGGLRTALYNYLYARKNNGKFILRIEDTDQKRVVPGSVENLQQMLSWTGIIPDEGPGIGGSYGPYVQSQRIDKYKEKAQELMELGLAYRCFCSETRLEIMRKEAMRARRNPRYDNKCRSLSPSEISDLMAKNQPFTIRFKICDGPINFDDVVFGSETINVSEFEGDFIILKSDGYPTYHFSCVVDDHTMDISHVLRGAEWLASTTKHIMLHQAFGWKPPKFAHLPLLVNRDRSKLSKRQASLAVKFFKENGYEPLPLLNLLCGIGSGFGLRGMELLELDELSQRFNLSEVNTASCCLDMEKLDVYSTKHFIKQLSNSDLANALIKQFRSLLKEKLGKRYEDQAGSMSDEYIKRILNCYKERICKLNELVEHDFQYLWAMPDEKELFQKLQHFNISIEDAIEDAEGTVQFLLELPEADFEISLLKDKMQDLSRNKKLSHMIFMRMLRILLTGHMNGPSIPEILSMLRKEESLRKLKEVIRILEAKASAPSLVAA